MALALSPLREALRGEDMPGVSERRLVMPRIVERGVPLDHARIEDNSQIDTDCPLKPLRTVTLEVEGQNKTIITRDITAEYVTEFNYLYHTQGTEFDTPRTQYLESYLKRMLEGEDYQGEIRVIILNRTKELNAQVSADGSIFISQELLNRLGTLDETMAVLAHELGHLIHKTTERAFSLRNGSFGMSWSHEFLATDLESPRLLEKVGLNSTAFSDAALKLEDSFSNERSHVHQAPLTRAINLKGHQKFVPSTTSAQEMQPLPPDLLSPARASNNELIPEVLASKDPETVATYLKRLHPDDRRNFIDSHVGYSRAEDKPFVLEGMRRYLQREFPDQGKAPQALFHFLGRMNLLPELAGLGPTETVQFMDSFSALFEEGKPLEWYQQVMQNPLKSKNKIPGTFHSEVLKFVDGQCIIEGPKSNLKSTTLTDETFLQVVQSINRFSDTSEESLSYPGHKTGVLTYLLFDYVEIRLATRKMTVPDGLRQFLQSVKDQGFERHIMGVIPPRQDRYPTLQKVYEHFIDIFQIPRPVEENLGKPVKSVADVLQDLDQNLATTPTKEAFLLYFYKATEEIKDHTNETDPKARHQELADQGRELMAWIEAVDLSSFSGIPVQQEIIRMRLLDMARSRFYLSIPNMSGEEMLNLIEYQMRQCRVNLAELSHGELMDLIEALDPPHFISTLRFEDIVLDTDRLYQLPFYQELRRKIPRIQAQTLPELQVILHERTNQGRSQARPFDMDIISHWLFEGFAESLITILPSITAADIPELLKVLRHMPDEASVDDLRLKLMQKYISDPEPSLPEKTDFFVQYYRLLGYFGLVTISQQIKTKAEFDAFSEKTEKIIQNLIDGSDNADNLASIDNVVSMVGGGMEVVQTIDPNRRASSTKLAQGWISRVAQGIDVRYQPPDHFRSQNFGTKPQALRDIFNRLQAAEPTQKIGIAIRALTDVDSPLLKTPESQRQLVELVCDVFSIKDSFSRLAIMGAVQSGRADYVGFQLSQLIGPYLFRNLAVNKVEYRKIRAEHRKDTPRNREGDDERTFYKNLEPIFAKSSHDLFQTGLVGGGGYRRYLPESQLYQESFQYKHDAASAITREVRSRFDLTSFDEITANSAEGLPDNQEAIIAAMERGGALFVRCLQIASQLFTFEPKIAARLADTLDQAEKMDSYRFWLALKTYGEKYPEFGTWVDQNLVGVDRALGGGSLYTAYRVHIRDQAGQEMPAVLKLLKPNSEAELTDAKQVALAGLEHVIAQGGRKEREDAQLAKRIVEMAFQWCRDDIRDPNYSQEDDAFHQVIEDFNAQHQGAVEVRQSERILTESFAMCESEVPGVTLKDYFSDPDGSAANKDRVFQAYKEFFGYQSLSSVSDLAHSDPHIGNYMLISDGDPIVLGMLDRRLYLHNTDRDKQVMQLLHDGQNKEFVSEFVRLVCDLNNQSDMASAIESTIKWKIVQRRVRGLLTQTTSFIGDFNVVLSVLEQSNVPVPYQWYLRIRNIFMAQRSLSQFGATT